MWSWSWSWPWPFEDRLEPQPATEPEVIEMAQIVSNKEGLTLGGKRYGRDEPIPADALKGLPERRLSKLKEQHVVREDSYTVRTEG